MEDNVTILDREIALEERLVGIRPQGPVTKAQITNRQLQIAGVLVGVVVALLGVAFSSHGTMLLRLLTAGLAAAIVAYALEQDRHLRRLRRLQVDSNQITLAVVDALATSGALQTDEDALALQSGLESSAPLVAAALADLVPADVARVRLAGPSGEVPVVAAYMGQINTPDDPRAAKRALRRGAPVQFEVPGGRTVLAIPIFHHGQAVAVLEVVSPVDTTYDPRHAVLGEAYARGVLATLRGVCL